MISYTGCRLEQTGREAEERNRKIKKFLTKRKGFDKLLKLSLERERQEP